MAKAAKSALLWQKYKFLKQTMQKECRRAYNSYMYKMIHEPYENGKKKFFRYVKSLRVDRCEVPVLIKDKMKHTTNQAKANVLNHHFSSVFTHDGEAPLPYMGPSPYPSLPDIEINIAVVTKLLKEINLYKATGPDCIPAKVLKEIAEELSPSLALIFSASLQQGKLPQDWKKALITPIFKKGDQTNPTNYRPVSLTSICCKLLQHIIHSNVMSHLNAHNIISDNQYGFCKRRSAELQLTRTVHDFAYTLNERKQTDAILLDFYKAFDKVPHHHLKLKLEYYTYGVRNQTLKWLSSFLEERTQHVVYCGYISYSANVISGVPQGTVLGPLLFLIYINDLPECVSSMCSLFADDCLVYRRIESERDIKILQNDLTNLELWVRKWLMTFNTEKCEAIQLSLKPAIPNSYTLYGEHLKGVTEAKYLGVTIDCKLSFTKHIDTVCKKANSMLAFIRRNLKSCQCQIKADAYLMHVRPILEYAAVVWAPHTRCDIDRLGAVQRRAARFVTSDYNRTSSVNVTLDNLNWSTLISRRQTSRLCLLYKIIHNLVDITLPNYITPATRFTRGHDQKFILPQPRFDAHKFNFFQDSIRLWNSLPLETVHAHTTDKFYKLLKSFIDN